MINYKALSEVVSYIPSGSLKFLSIGGMNMSWCLPQLIYRIAGNFRGVLIFVIFVTIPRVTKFSTHEIFHPRIFSRLLRIGLRESRNLKPRKLILNTRDSFSRIFAPLKITRYTVLVGCKHRASEGVFYIGGRGFVCQIIEPVTFARCAFIFALCNIAWADI